MIGSLMMGARDIFWKETAWKIRSRIKTRELTTKFSLSNRQKWLNDISYTLTLQEPFRRVGKASPIKSQGIQKGKNFSYSLLPSYSGSIHHVTRTSLIGYSLDGRRGGTEGPEQRSIMISAYVKIQRKMIKLWQHSPLSHTANISKCRSPIFRDTLSKVGRGQSKGCGKVWRKKTFYFFFLFASK